MVSAKQLSAELAAVEAQIEDVMEQRILDQVFHPLAEKHRNLIARRGIIKSKLDRLSRNNIIPFRRRAAAV